MQSYTHLSDSASDSEQPYSPPPRWTPLHQDPRLALLPPHARPSGEMKGETERWKMVVIRLLPVVATVAWLLTLLLLLFSWLYLDHRRLYKWYLGGMPYISDVGAVHKSFFRWGCSVTAIFYAASLGAERWLRARRVLSEATEERWLWIAVGVLDVLVGTLGAAALVLLSIYDAFDHPKLHSLFMSSFIIAVGVSGTLQTVEVEHLMHEHPDRKDLLDATYLKWIFLSIAVLCGGGFWIMYYICDGDATKGGECWRVTTASAVLEWAACFMCDAYLATLILDVWPAYRHTPLPHRVWANAQGIQGIHVLQPDGGYMSWPLGAQVEREEWEKEREAVWMEKGGSMRRSAVVA
ncbi:Frag1/DRAM/Sfk1 family-domain-containing protein [Leucosporidium creatinivorum]|uniref:Frag1/DRAM/Sfk1 family-domain-containing protein n=1 Tax=Leucosporidium creatinivorum TaxID=106004 RepID=A0A1Y2D4M6_9BASI|nr:Frag1/DRAM/Sfk1 family-domain-containing protein [Leucosporidium creatinivorum]